MVPLLLLCLDFLQPPVRHGMRESLPLPRRVRHAQNIRMDGMPADPSQEAASMLQRRIEEMKAEEDLPLVVLPETMLPRQRLNVDTWSWLAGALGNNTRVGLLSRASPTLGVEAVLADDGATLVGQRVFMRTEAGEAGASIGDALTTRVRYLDLDLADAMDGARTQSRAVSLICTE